ncbi:MAG: peptidoglycan DD-metalloendopeptidase family protein [Gammaproteobacteria bacterium]
MNLIILTRSGRTARTLGLPVLPLVAAVLGLGGLFIGSMALGYAYARSTSSALPQHEVGAMQANLQTQREELAQVREEAGEQLDALAIRLGQLNAHVIRLNALGKQLTGMADLDDGEFDFDSAPPVGGPAAPLPEVHAQLPDVLSDLDSLEQRIDGQVQQLEVLENLMVNRKLNERVRPSGKPVKSGWISSYFGKRIDPITGKHRRHKGLDFAGKTGSEVIAVGDGVVSWSGDRYGYGNLVEISHGNGYFTRYAHNSVNLAAVGDQVEQGQTIALMGSTGRSTGPHVHFEVWQNGRPVNPASYINRSK